MGRKFQVVPPIRNEKDVNASVLASVYPHNFYGQNQVVFIDKGDEDGLKIGNRLFVVRRAFRVNDSLPDNPTPRWQWQRGGWLLVDRTTARVSPINLPEFDVQYSAASWYRDYVAYCGVADDGKKTYAIVAQLSRRKPVLKKPLPGEMAEDATPDSACSPPSWQRSPARVTFGPAGAAQQTFAIRGHVVDLINDTEDEEEGSK